MTATSTGTPSLTPSPSGTSSMTPTMTASGTASVSVGTTPTGTDTGSSTPTSTGSLTASGTPTPSTTPPIRTGVLLIDMQAVDFNATSAAWDNRVSPGVVSMLNGDFVGGGANTTFPVTATINGAPAVVFNGTATGAARYLLNNASLPLFNGLYGNSDWSYEAWLLHSGLYNTAAESSSAPQSPVFQWGLRNGTTCGSAHLGIGDSASDGAGGHYVRWRRRVGGGGG